MFLFKEKIGFESWEFCYVALVASANRIQKLVILACSTCRKMKTGFESRGFCYVVLVVNRNCHIATGQIPI